MYHRVLIPEKDQRTHQLFWRDMDPSREPDVYVKTVLTFGNKPAPSMAHIALKKMVKGSKNEYPKAAEMLMKIVYMDDICDSDGTLE